MKISIPVQIAHPTRSTEITDTRLLLETLTRIALAGRHWIRAREAEEVSTLIRPSLELIPLARTKWEENLRPPVKPTNFIFIFLK